MSEESTNPVDSYEQLRHWYLARLRYLAQEEANRTMATPASRIASDKKAIQQLIATGAFPRIEKTVTVVERRYYFIYILLGWFLLQLIFLSILSVQEKAFLQGLIRFDDITFMSLVPGISSIQLNSITDKLCFFAFFVLPGMVIALLPADRFASASHKLFKLASSERAAGISMFLLLAVVLSSILFMHQVSSGPAALSLAGEVAEDPERCVLAWTCLLLIFPILCLKKDRAALETINEKIGQIQAEVAGQFQEKSSGEPGQRLAELEESVQELLQRERAIADFSKTVIVCFDRDMTIEAVSLSSFLQWGYFQHELLGENLSCILFQEDCQRFADAIKSAHSSFELHARIRRGDKSIMDCSWFIDWSTQLQKFFAACEDITDRMNLERARNDFIAQLTHDMRSPLTGVSMSLELISENTFGEVPARLKSTVNSSMQSLSRVLQLINDILDGEKLRHSKQTIEFKSVDIVQLCKSGLDEIRSLALERTVRLSLILSRQNILVRADEKLLRRVVANLLSNALSFSGEGAELKLEIMVTSDTALVKITDQGPGIHQDYHRVIFERFGAPKSASMQNRPSTGIGLSFCRDIIIAQGGLIGVESELGKGSTFWFTVPLFSKP